MAASQSKRIADDQSDKLLQQMALLSESVKMLGTQMREGFATEGARRKEDDKSLEEKSAARMEEQHARQRRQSEIVQGFKNEENARKLVQNELAVTKFKSLKMGSGSTVCSEASTGVELGSGTFAGPAAIHFALE